MKNELLAMNPKALQFLHAAAGFDFCKPYEIHRIDGRFTRRTVGALIPEGHKAAALLVPDPVGVRWSRQDTMYYIRVTRGDFDPTRQDNVSYWNYKAPVNGKIHDIDYFYSKGEFETIRKNGTKHLYIVTQELEITMQGRSSFIDFTERFHYNTECSYLRIKRIDHNEDWMKYESGSWFGSRPSKPVDLIDKSGYILDRRRTELQRRTAALKAERQKAAALVTDYTDKYNELCADLKRNREQLAAAILDPEGYENMSQYARRCYDLGRAQDYLNSYVEKTAAHNWSSPAAMLRHLEIANDYINKEV